MNKWTKEVQQSLLDSEADAIKALEKSYKAALKDINEKIKLYESNLTELDEALAVANDSEEIKLLKSMQRSKIYQKQYQEALKGQVSGILDKMHSDQYSTIDSYLHQCYETSYIGTMYDLAKQGIPIIQPINQAAVTKAILTDSKIVEGYYKRLGVNTAKLKKVITQEISRGIASGLSYAEIARNVDNASRSGFYNAYRIARTEGHRIQQSAAYDAQTAIKAKGIDILRQWDAVLDGRTRPTHRMLDGQIVGVDEPFEVGGTKVMKPGDFGIAEEDINCRCIVTTRIPEDLDEAELEALQKRAEFFGLDESKQFDDFKEKYLKATAESEKQWGIMYDNTDVNREVINSDLYHSKFSQITDNSETNESIYNTAKTILNHCDGTEHEDIYLIGMDGEIISKVTDSVSKLGVNYTDEFRQALADASANNTPIISIHNHPYGTPPSPDDFKKAYENNYAIGVAVGHNGQVYIYSNNSVELTQKDCDTIDDGIKTLYLLGTDIDRASKSIYTGIGLEYTILEGVE